MIIIVCGSRTFDNPAWLFRKLDRLTRKLDKRKLTIVTGAQRSKAGKDHWYGADYWAERWAGNHGVHLVRYHAAWEKGKGAGMARNSEMVEQSGAAVLVAIWDGCSPGTADAVAKARRKGLRVIIWYFEE